MLRWPIAFAGLAVLGMPVVFAQTTARPDVLTQLLDEVRQLRLVMQRQGADTARIQLLISRLTIQETRVSRIARDLDNVRDSLARTNSDQRQMTEQAKNMEEAIPQATDAAERITMEQQLKMMKRQIEELGRQEVRLRGQESELESALGAEQARWVEISNRLDELERALARP